MAVFIIINIIIENKNDRKMYDEYIEKVKPIIESYGGKYIIRSEQISILAGTWKPDRVIVIEFKSKEQLDNCFSSDEYKSIKALRENSVAANAIIIEQ